MGGDGIGVPGGPLVGACTLESTPIGSKAPPPGSHVSWRPSGTNLHETTQTTPVVGALQPSAYGPARQAPASPGCSPYSGAQKAGVIVPKKTMPKAFVKPTPPPMATPNTVVLLGGGLPLGVEKDIEDRVRDVCIAQCFSNADEVRYVSPSLAYIDFPYIDAARAFVRATGGTLTVRGRAYKLQNSSVASNVSAAIVGDEGGFVTADGSVLERPTDTVMVRQLGDMDEVQLRRAVSAVVPAASIRGVRILTDRGTRKSKGFGFVQFRSAGEAEAAFSRILASGAFIEGRKVSISYAKPQTHEQTLEEEMSYRTEQVQIQAQATQALTGINADMWASYFNFVNKGQDGAGGSL